MATDQIKQLALETSRLEDEIAEKLSRLQNLMIKQRDFLVQQIALVEERSRFIKQEILEEQEKAVADRAKFEKQKIAK